MMKIMCFFYILWLENASNRYFYLTSLLFPFITILAEMLI